MKGLEALEELKNHISDSDGYLDLYKTMYVKIIKKELKAIEIIKDICKLKVYKNKLGQCFLEGINILFAISQETYDLLKEVLL